MKNPLPKKASFGAVLILASVFVYYLVEVAIARAQTNEAENTIIIQVR